MLKAANLPLPGYKARELVQNLTTTEDGRISFDEFISVSDILFQRINTEEDKKKKKRPFLNNRVCWEFSVHCFSWEYNFHKTDLFLWVNIYFSPKCFHYLWCSEWSLGHRRAMSTRSHGHNIWPMCSLAGEDEQDVTKLEILQLAGTN